MDRVSDSRHRRDIRGLFVYLPSAFGVAITRQNSAGECQGSEITVQRRAIDGELAPPADVG